MISVLRFELFCCHSQLNCRLQGDVTRPIIWIIVDYADDGGTSSSGLLCGCCIIVTGMLIDSLRLFCGGPVMLHAERLYLYAGPQAVMSARCYLPKDTFTCAHTRKVPALHVGPEVGTKGFRWSLAHPIRNGHQQRSKFHKVGVAQESSLAKIMV